MTDTTNTDSSSSSIAEHVARRGLGGVWLTLGDLRARTAHLPDETPITVDTQGLEWDESMWVNVSLDPAGIPGSFPPVGDEPYSILLYARDDFDTRQW